LTLLTLGMLIRFSILWIVLIAVRRFPTGSKMSLEVGIFVVRNVQSYFGFQGDFFCNMKNTEPLLFLLNESISCLNLITSESGSFLFIRILTRGL
jgi:hypothetical protein